jgi:uncharacterized membrane protein HdeD (DUF308 family)
VVSTVSPIATTIPATHPLISAPGLSAAAIATSAPLSARATKPSVRTLRGSATRLSVGHSSALSRAMMSAVTSAPAGPLTWKSESSALRTSSAAQSRASTTRPRTTYLRIAHSLAERRVTTPHPLRVTTPHPRRSYRHGMEDLERLAKEWYMLAILGVVSIVAGILAIAYPDITLLAVGIIFGIYLLIAGIYAIVEAIAGDPASRALAAITGILGLIAGLVCLRRPGASLLAVVIVLGIYLIVAGVAHLVRAVGATEGRAWQILSALADIVLGILILVIPDISLVTLALLFGISLIVRGVFSCVGAFQLRKVHKQGSDVAPPMDAAPA